MVTVTNGGAARGGNGDGSGPSGDVVLVAAPFLVEEGHSWQVTAGRLDIFSIPAAAGVDGGPRRYLFSASPGDLVPGAPPATNVVYPISLIAVPIGGTSVLTLDDEHMRSRPVDDAAREEALERVERMARLLARALADRSPPRVQHTLHAGGAVTMKAGESAAPADETVWVKVRQGKLRVVGLPALSCDAEAPPLPAAKSLWLTADEETTLDCLATADVYDEGSAWDGLERLADLFALLAAQRAWEDEEAELARFTARAEQERRARDLGLRELAEVLGELPAAGVAPVDGDALLSTLQVLGPGLGIEFRPAPEWERNSKRSDPLQAICRASRIRSRQIALRGGWWTRDSGSLLAFRKDEGTPVALVRDRHGYQAVCPADGTRTAVDARVAAGFELIGFSFYRPFPERSLRGRDLLELALSPVRGEVSQLLMIALGAALLGLLVPWATNKMLSEVVPVSSRSGAIVLMSALLAVQVGIAFFDAAKAFVLVRMEGRTNSTLQAGVVDRLLTLSASFFRQFSVGDLASRASSINAVRDLLSGAAATSLLSGIFALVFLLQLWVYSWRLALVALALMVFAIVTTAFLVSRSISSQRTQQTMAGRLSGFTVQLIGAIPKLRVAAAEDRAFAQWARRFREQKEAAWSGSQSEIGLQVFNTVLPLLASMALFAYAGWMTSEGKEYALAAGTFVAFNAAFGTFFGSVVSFSNTMITTLVAIPMLERAQPILSALPELSGDRTDPGELFGRVEVSHLTFRYREDGPTILEDVSFHASPGEFIAFVGPSGSGKSTCLRILLGFEKPEAGAVYFDGQDMDSLDVTALRIQIGVVLQSSKLSQGDVFQNIVGSAPLTLDDAWEAADAAGLSEDIERMPMQMHTVVSEGGSTLSGGQRQRLLIARALVRKPRIILFDEATSALDNRTQELVSRSLEDTRATRIVIAHRLSTIRNADRIYVMEGGRIVQAGTYDELWNQPGLFSELVKRQLA